MTTSLAPGDQIRLSTATEKHIGFILIKKTTSGGQVVGQLSLTNDPSSAARAAFQAAEEAAEAFAFAAMELEESALATLGLQLELPNGSKLALGKDIGNLLVTEQCTHIAFKTLKNRKSMTPDRR